MTMYAIPEPTKKKKENQVSGPPKIRPNSAGLSLKYPDSVTVAE